VINSLDVKILDGMHQQRLS